MENFHLQTFFYMRLLLQTFFFVCVFLQTLFYLHTIFFSDYSLRKQFISKFSDPPTPSTPSKNNGLSLTLLWAISTKRIVQPNRITSDNHPT